MFKNIIIGGLLAVTVFLGATVVRVENERYALLVGVCDKAADKVKEQYECLQAVQTRTSPLWHLWYALVAH
jgi:hypothetical protein